MVTQKNPQKEPEGPGGSMENDEKGQKNTDVTDGNGLLSHGLLGRHCGPSLSEQFGDDANELEDLSEDGQNQQEIDEVRPKILPDLQSEFRDLDNIRRGTGRGAGRARTGSQTRPGRGRSQNPAYFRRTLERLEEDIQEGIGIKIPDVVHYGGFFAKIDDKRHRTDLNPIKGGKEGLGFLGMIAPDEYIHPKLRGDVDRTYTDSKGRVKNYEPTREGYELSLTDPRLAAEKNMEIWSRAYRINQEQRRPEVRELLTDMVMATPVVSTHSALREF